MKAIFCVFGVMLLISVAMGAHLRNGSILKWESSKKLAQLNEINNTKNQITVETSYTHQGDEINDDTTLAHQENRNEDLEEIHNDEQGSDVSIKDAVSESVNNEISQLEDLASFIQLEEQSPSSFVTLVITTPKTIQLNNAFIELQAAQVPKQAQKSFVISFQQLSQVASEPQEQVNDTESIMPDDVLIDGSLQTAPNSQQINIGLSMQESPVISDEEYSKLEQEFADNPNSILEDKFNGDAQLQPEELEYERLKKSQEQEQQLDESGQQMLKAETIEANQSQVETSEIDQSLDLENQMQPEEPSPLLTFDSTDQSMQQQPIETVSHDQIVW